MEKSAAFYEMMEKAAREKEMNLADTLLEKNISGFMPTLGYGLAGTAAGGLTGAGVGAGIGALAGKSIGRGKAALGAGALGLLGGAGLGAIGGSIYGGAKGTQRFVQKHTGNKMTTGQALKENVLKSWPSAIVGGGLGSAAGGVAGGALGGVAALARGKNPIIPSRMGAIAGGMVGAGAGKLYADAYTARDMLRENSKKR